MLDVLGLADAEELAYRALVEVPSADAAELAERLGCQQIEAARSLAALETLGLAARSSGGTDRYVASPPSVALAALAVQREEELRRAQREIEALTEIYRGTDTDRSISDVVDVVRGAKAVAQRFAQLQMAARDEVLGFVKAAVAVVPPEENTEEDAAVTRGVRYRVVIERSSFERPGFFAAAADSLEKGEEVRVVPELPIRLLIVDRRIALVPLLSGSAGIGALIVHRSGMLDALLALFDQVWRNGLPLVLGTDGMVEGPPSDGLSELDSRILGLLLAGLTDQAVANQLGLSMRTVQRRVRALMDIVAADTRLQLGFHAARRGWI
ncbi:sugar-specific transcriptional regulator TrmB [Kribbella amoyensis]|uniref:Sugar-specific transcriptional regulator TrmB n=1 Tax=Kribbella amoyensis TaxID=996641 RepID=A0A561B2G1_9ACTN|nr:helix-turn-helix domain-containing protein [Kribbella amoyensis]TWD73055.1 sugar-specific transcriptional regulator TrmB [Kribbella amoyensis]